MVRLDLVRRRQRWNEEITKRRRIILAGAAPSSRPHAAAPSRADTRPDAPSRARASARRARVAAPFAGVRRNGIYGRRRWRRRHRRLDLRLRLLGLYRRYRQRFGFGHHSGIGLPLHELDPILVRSGAVRASATAAGRPRAPAANRRLVGEVRRADDRRQNEKKDQCVHEQRRNDPFPSFFLLALLSERRITRSYFTSLGVVAMILTPAPRATSMAEIPSEYFTVGSPLMKMILSGRGS